MTYRSPMWSVIDPIGSRREMCAYCSLVLYASHSLSYGSLLFVSPSAKWWEQLVAYGSISTLQVILRGKMWFANSVKWNRHLQMLLWCSNTSLCVRSFLQMFIYLLKFLLGCKWEGWQAHEACPIVIVPERQEGLSQLLLLYPQPHHKGCSIIPR